jgi:hypothetical protein
VGGHPSLRGPLVVGRLVLAFVFVFVRDIGTEIGADGCAHGRTHLLAWLSEHSQRKWGGGPSCAWAATFCIGSFLW